MLKIWCTKLCINDVAFFYLYLMCLAWEDNYCEITCGIDNKRVSRDILGDGFISICLDIGDVSIMNVFWTLIITHTHVE